MTCISCSKTVAVWKRLVLGSSLPTVGRFKGSGFKVETLPACTEDLIAKLAVAVAVGSKQYVYFGLMVEGGDASLGQWF